MRIVNMERAEGDESAPYRVIVIENRGLSDYHYFESTEEAIRAMADGLGDGAMVAYVEERDDNEWIEFYDERGCNTDELIEEFREREGDETLQDTLNRL